MTYQQPSFVARRWQWTISSKTVRDWWRITYNRKQATQSTELKSATCKKISCKYKSVTIKTVQPFSAYCLVKLSPKALTCWTFRHGGISAASLVVAAQPNNAPSKFPKCTRTVIFQFVLGSPNEFSVRCKYSGNTWEQVNGVSYKLEKDSQTKQNK